MLLKLTTDHHSHLSLLNNVDTEVATEFAALAIQFLTSSTGINRKLFKSASNKLQIDAETVENCIVGLMHLFVEAAKSKISEVDFHDSVVVHGFSDELATGLQTLYAAEAKRIVGRLRAPVLPRYKTMEWRLDVKLASRSLHNQLEPAVLLKLAVEDHAGVVDKLVKVDVPMLHHMIAELEAALVENKSKHVQRFVRNIT